jgi:hypothetical protein
VARDPTRLSAGLFDGTSWLSRSAHLENKGPSWSPSTEAGERHAQVLRKSNHAL